MELHRRTFSKRFEAGGEARLHIENRNGAINIRRHDQAAIEIEVVAEVYAPSAREADDEAARIERAITASGSRVDIITPDLPRPEWFFFGRGPKVDYDIRVPADTTIEALNRNGHVVLAGTRRPVRAESRNGRVQVEDVSGEVTAASRNGRINISRIAGAVEVSGANGHITIEKVQGAVTAKAGNGSLDITDSGAAVRASTTNGSVRFSGRVAGDLALQATNGSVRVAVTPDSRFELDAESRHGSVRSDLPVRERPPSAAGTATPRVQLRTTNGSIRLTEL